MCMFEFVNMFRALPVKTMQNNYESFPKVICRPGNVRHLIKKCKSKLLADMCIKKLNTFKDNFRKLKGFEGNLTQFNKIESSQQNSNPNEPTTSQN